MRARPRIVVGLSGGVDSAVTALLLRETGFEPVGVTLRLRACDADVGAGAGNDDGARRSCCGADAVATAGAVAHQLGLRHYILDGHVEFAEQVLRPCWDAFARACTPNPCILCNAAVRFARLAAFADGIGAAEVATGHYARVQRDAAGGVRLLRGADPRKDQSYFLHAVPAPLLARVRFPLGDMRKTQVRELARQHALANAARAESQDVCFTGPDGHFAEYLRRRFGGTAVPGVIRDRAGQVLGRHDGIHHFTLGQRRGLGVAVGAPLRVCALDAATGSVTVSPAADDIASAGCVADDCRWLGGPPAVGAALEAQVRYRQHPVLARVAGLSADGNSVEVQFSEPVAAVTPGQWLVLYDGAAVVGGGTIRGNR